MNKSREASVHALVGAYAIDALDEGEHTRFEQHLDACGDCQAEVASLRETASVLGGAEELQPSASVRRHVLAGIGGDPAPEQAETDESSVDDAAQDRRTGEAPGGDVVVLSRRRFRVAAAAVAAAVIAVIGGAVVSDQLGAGDDAQVQARKTLAERVQSAEDAEVVPVDLGDGATATVVRSAAMNQAVVITENMPPPPEGMVYELWLDDRQAGFTPAGLMSTASDQTVVLEGDAARATGVGITVEPARGSRAPTTDPIAVFPFDSGQA